MSLTSWELSEFRKIDEKSKIKQVEASWNKNRDQLQMSELISSASSRASSHEPVSSAAPVCSKRKRKDASAAPSKAGKRVAVAKERVTGTTRGAAGNGN